MTPRRKESDQVPRRSDPQAASREFWEVFEAHYDDVTDRLTDWARGQPQLGPLVDMTPEELAERKRVSRELLRKGLVEGEWEPYSEFLGEQGAGFALMGVPFAAWIELVAGFRSHVRPLLLVAHSGDPETLDALLAAMNNLADRAVATVGEAYLRTKERQIRQQQEELLELSTPVLWVRQGLLILPVIGTIDSVRARQLTERLLEGIQEYRAKAVVLDITGVPAVDSAVANHLLQTVQAGGLMGAKVLVTGLSSANAQTLVRIGVDLSGLNTYGDLHSGIEEANRLLGYRVVNVEEGPRTADIVRRS